MLSFTILCMITLLLSISTLSQSLVLLPNTTTSTTNIIHDNNINDNQKDEALSMLESQNNQLDNDDKSHNQTQEHKKTHGNSQRNKHRHDTEMNDRDDYNIGAEAPSPSRWLTHIRNVSLSTNTTPSLPLNSTATRVSPLSNAAMIIPIRPHDDDNDDNNNIIGNNSNGNLFDLEDNPYAGIGDGAPDGHLDEDGDTTKKDPTIWLLNFTFEFQHNFDVQSFQNSPQYTASVTLLIKLPEINQICNINAMVWVPVSNNTVNFYIPYNFTPHLQLGSTGYVNNETKKRYSMHPDEIETLWKDANLDHMWLKRYNYNIYSGFDNNDDNDETNKGDHLPGYVKGYKYNLKYHSRESCLMFSPIQTSQYCNIQGRASMLCQSDGDCEAKYTRCINNVCSFSNGTSPLSHLQYSSNMIFAIVLAFYVGTYVAGFDFIDINPC